MKNKTYSSLLSRHPERSRRVLAFLKNASTSLSMTAIMVVMLSINTATAQTNVSGFISANTTWNLAGSPYVVVGNTILSSGYTLTIDAGVIVKFDSARVLQVDGELHAVGTAANRITYTSNQAVPDSGDWGKIQFSNISTDAIFDVNGNYLSGCIMKYCDVLYGGGLGFGVVHIDYSSLYMSNCRISHSDADGVYCIGFVKIDSSSIRYCSGVGMNFANVTSPYCPYKIQYDTLEYNTMGGIKRGATVATGCSGWVVIISNNYFANNGGNGALNLNYGLYNGLAFQVVQNEFIDNSSSDFFAAGAITINGYAVDIENNRFISNQGYLYSAINLDKIPNDTIANNIFCGNVCTSNHPNAAMINIFQTCCYTSVINDNYVANNVTNGGTTLRYYGMTSTNNISKIFVYSNEFTDNVGKTEISLLVSTNNPALQFAHMANNNFLSDSTQYTLLNNVSFSGPTIDADSNYWNSISTQHIDSVIYDFFDDANLSVVNYSPILSSPAYFIGSCTEIIHTGITNDINKVTEHSSIFPNPFTTTATIKFSRAVHAATLRIYNMYGQLIMETSNINGESFQVNAEHFRSGVYVYEVTEKDKKICGGKAVVY